MTDFHAMNHGSIVTLHPETPEAQDWIDENLPSDFNGAIEHRYFADIAKGILAHGHEHHQPRQAGYRRLYSEFRKK